MTKAQLVEDVARRFGWRPYGAPRGHYRKPLLTLKETTAVVEEFLRLVEESVKRTGRFHWPGFGVWSIRHRKARRIRDPQGGGLIRLPRMKTVGFRPAKELKERL